MRTEARLYTLVLLLLSVVWAAAASCAHAERTLLFEVREHVQLLQELLDVRAHNCTELMPLVSVLESAERVAWELAH